MASSSKVQLVTPLGGDREAIVAMGIKLTEIKGNGNRVNATIPQGWYYVSLDGNISTEITIFDDKNRARIHSTKVKTRFLAFAKSETRVYRRYSIQVINRHDNHPDGEFEIVLCRIDPSFENERFRINDETVYSAGRTRIEPTYNSSTHTYSDSHASVRLCMQHANQNFPGWQNPKAYWE